MKLFSLSLITLSLVFSGCGGSSGSSNQSIDGQFKDANTSGLKYETGSVTSSTDENGGFTCNEGDAITFSVGSVVLGSSTCELIITPINIVEGGSIDSTAVINISRFLQFLDEDGDSANGIQISDQIQLLAENWAAVDFSTNNLETTLADIISDAESLVAGNLPDADTAQTHLEETLRCAYSGAFSGTYSGDDNGTWGLIIDPVSGVASGASLSESDDEDATELDGSAPIVLDQTVTFITGNAGTDTTFGGEFENTNSLSGTWDNSQLNESGEFSGSRIGGAADTRYSGFFTGDDGGVIAFDIDGDNISGAAYSSVFNEISVISGTVSGLSISGTVGASTFAGAISGAGTATPSISGTWTGTSEPASGEFAATGCNLN